MATPFAAQQISAEFWALLHRMGLPKEITCATIRLAVDEPVTVTADFYLTQENGELKLVEGEIEKASADFVIVRADELETMRAQVSERIAAAREEIARGVRPPGKRFAL